MHWAMRMRMGNYVANRETLGTETASPCLLAAKPCAAFCLHFIWPFVVLKAGKPVQRIC